MCTRFLSLSAVILVVSATVGFCDEVADALAAKTAATSAKNSANAQRSAAAEAWNDADDYGAMAWNMWSLGIFNNSSEAAEALELGDSYRNSGTYWLNVGDGEFAAANTMYENAQSLYNAGSYISARDEWNDAVPLFEDSQGHAQTAEQQSNLSYYYYDLAVSEMLNES